MSSKIGLLVEGGGMKCAFSAGVLDVFLDEDIHIDRCYGVSAGSANSASFVAKQRGRNRRFYCEHSKDPEYFGIKSLVESGSLFGLEYIYATLSNTNGKDPIDFDTLMENPCELIMVATDENGNAKYFDKSDMTRDHYEAVMASSALPALCKPIEIDGVQYFDGGVSDSLPIGKMIEDGCDKFIILMSKPRGYTMERQPYKRIYRKVLKAYPGIIRALDRRHLNYNRSIYKIRKLEKEGKAFIYYPSSLIPLNTYKTDAEVMEMLYENGVASAKAKMPKLKEFLDE